VLIVAIRRPATPSKRSTGILACPTQRATEGSPRYAVCGEVWAADTNFVDTPGAYPGIGAEERGQGEAIARNLREMAKLRVPIVTTITGEGGSGGALAIAASDRVLMMENSVYS